MWQLCSNDYVIMGTCSANQDEIKLDCTWVHCPRAFIWCCMHVCHTKAINIMPVLPVASLVAGQSAITSEHHNVNMTPLLCWVFGQRLMICCCKIRCSGWNTFSIELQSFRSFSTGFVRDIINYITLLFLGVNNHDNPEITVLRKFPSIFWLVYSKSGSQDRDFPVGPPGATLYT